MVFLTMYYMSWGLGYFATYVLATCLLPIEKFSNYLL